MHYSARARARVRASLRPQVTGPGDRVEFIDAAALRVVNASTRGGAVVHSYANATLVFCFDSYAAAEPYNPGVYGYYYTGGRSTTTPVNFQTPGTQAAVLVGWVLAATLSASLFVWRGLGGDSSVVWIEPAPSPEEEEAFDDEACIANSSRGIVGTASRLAVSLIEAVAHLLLLAETVLISSVEYGVGPCITTASTDYDVGRLALAPKLLAYILLSAGVALALRRVAARSDSMLVMTCGCMVRARADVPA